MRLHKATIPDTVTFFSSGLLSKWGFGDGDMLEWVGDYVGDGRHRAILTACVREFLLPVIEQDVTVREIQCSHNPIRAATVNGEDVSKFWFDVEDVVTLTPASVEVTGEDVLKVAREVVAARGTATPEADPRTLRPYDLDTVTLCRTITTDAAFKLTGGEVADLFSEMSERGQAEFFNRLSEADWLVLQLEAISKAPNLTPGGRVAMSRIGEYSRP